MYVETVVVRVYVYTTLSSSLAMSVPPQEFASIARIDITVLIAKVKELVNI